MSDRTAPPRWRTSDSARRSARADHERSVPARARALGLGLGWAGLYFTTFVTLWRGRTPGKRIMGIRVIRLDGQQLGRWAAFERDRDRQAVQDKISETVVIRDAPRVG